MALLETYANNTSSTLASGIIAGDTTLSVASATGFPTTGQFRILIDSEILLVTAVSGTTFTVVRGVEGTTAASHSGGMTVTQILTRDGLGGIGGTVILSDSFSLMPSSSVVGREYLPTDGTHLFRDNGIAWRPFGPLFPMTLVDNTAYSWVNQGSASVSTTHGSLILSDGAGSGTDNLRLRVKTIPSAPYTATMAIIPLLPFPSNFNACGICLRDSGTGKIITFGLASDSTQFASGQVLSAIKWNSATSFSGFYTLTPTIAANYAAANTLMLGPCLWLQIVDNNTNRLLKISNDGINFQQLHSVSRTDFITPDQIGFFVNPNNASFGVTLDVLSWVES